MTESNYSVPQMAGASVPEEPTGDMQVKTPYDYLKDAFAKEVRNDPITLEVPMRPGVHIEFDTNITSEQFEMWHKQATVSRGRRGQESNVDNVKFCALVIFNKATVFLIDGQEVYLDTNNTKPLNFYEGSVVRDLVGINTTTNSELVKAVYRNDAHVLAAGQQIMEAAGYGEELDELQQSPTKR